MRAAVKSRNVRARFSNRATTSILALFILLLPLNASAQNERINNQLERAALFVRNSQLNEAERQLLQILKIAPNEARALNLLGTIRAQQGRLNEAEALFARALRSDSRLIAAHMNLAHLFL